MDITLAKPKGVPISLFRKKTNERVAVIGLGYVGLPLGIELSKKYETVLGFDIDLSRVDQLKATNDQTREVDSETLADTTLSFTSDESKLQDASVYIVTVPTPIDGSNRPDLNPLRSACRIVGKYLNKDDVVVIESTVYPGVTEDICGPILAETSGLIAFEDFGVAYSAERISPGDKERPLTKLVKNVAGDSDKTRERVADIYREIIDAGVFEAASIKVAEAAKVLENTQRDVNIALMNELSQICHLIDVRAADVIEAAATKWNFAPYSPGLVGGHCISVDPYYLTALAEEMGYHPALILAGRRINDDMPRFVAQKAVKLLAKRSGNIQAARIGIWGVTFKENVPDMRNSKVVDLVHELRDFGLNPVVHDLIAQPEDAAAAGIELVTYAEMKALDLAILAVPHNDYLSEIDLWGRLQHDGILMDIKSHFRKARVPDGKTYWCL